MDTEDQIRNLFQKKGLNPEKIRYNDSLDYYLVNIGVEGTEEQFLEGVMGLGSTEPVDETVDTDKLKSMESRIQGSKVPAGTVNVINTMSDAHFKVEVDE